VPPVSREAVSIHMLDERDVSVATGEGTLASLWAITTNMATPNTAAKAPTTHIFDKEMRQPPQDAHGRHCGAIITIYRHSTQLRNTPATTRFEFASKTIVFSCSRCCTAS